MGQEDPQQPLSERTRSCDSGSTRTASSSAWPARPSRKQDYKDKERQATTRDGEPIWTVRLDAIEPEREARETIWVEVAGEQPKLTFDGYAVVHGLVFAPWVGRDGKIKRAFRAESVEPVQSGKSAQAA